MLGSFFSFSISRPPLYPSSLLCFPLLPPLVSSPCGPPHALVSQSICWDSPKNRRTWPEHLCSHFLWTEWAPSSHSLLFHSPLHPPFTPPTPPPLIKANGWREIKREVLAFFKSHRFENLSRISKVANLSCEELRCVGALRLVRANRDGVPWLAKMDFEKGKNEKRKVFEILCKIYVYLEQAKDLGPPSGWRCRGVWFPSWLLQRSLLRSQRLVRVCSSLSVRRFIVFQPRNDGIKLSLFGVYIYSGKGNTFLAY